jgi:hypothetical protein
VALLVAVAVAVAQVAQAGPDQLLLLVVVVVRELLRLQQDREQDVFIQTHSPIL